MTRKVDYLVINEALPDSSKLREAIQWNEIGFPKIIISDSQLFKAFREIPPLPFEETLKMRQEAEKLQAGERNRQRPQAVSDAQIGRDAQQAAWKELQEKRERAAEEERARLAEKERLREEKKLEKAAEKAQKEADRKEKEAALQEARASATILYRPGEEPSRLHDRIQTLLTKLGEAYPDHVIVNLAKDHKKWGETITELYRALGYADNVSFLEAYGFSYSRENKGRPSTLAPEAVIEELKRRYPEGTTLNMSQVTAENKDLPIKTLQNNAPAIFGMGLRLYLQQIGLLK